MRILVDGYNLLKTLPTFSHQNADIETLRSKLNQLLRIYKKIKGHQITVVYDSAGGGLFGKEEVYKCAGIREIFTAKGETADDVIKKIAIQNPHNLVIVTADRGVAIVCEKAGATVISPKEFEEKIFSAQYVYSKGTDEIDEEESLYFSRKRGPSRKLPKKQRKDLKLKEKL